VIPAAAAELIPVLMMALVGLWEDYPAYPAFFAGKIEQETCYSLTHRMCWNPRAELKTPREYGFGLGQLTIAYRADGSVLFNKWAELRSQHPELRAWQWDDRYNAKYQMDALVLMNRGIYRRIERTGCATHDDCLSFMASAYNGGEGGLAQDRALCRNTPGCDPARWAGHVARTSTKSRVVWKGYGQSAFDINRGYVTNIFARSKKYEAAVEAAENEAWARQ
jgi:hypothetical protein